MTDLLHDAVEKARRADDAARAVAFAAEEALAIAYDRYANTRLALRRAIAAAKKETP